MSFKDLEKWKQAHVLANMLYLHTKYLIPITLSLILYTFPSIPFADAAILTKPANNLGLVGYWNFNEGTSTYAGDFSANSNTGTLTNMANPPTAISGWGNGKFDGGLNFDGVDDYVGVADSNSLDMTANWSVATWVKFDSFYTGDCENNAIISKGYDSLNGHYALIVAEPDDLCGPTTSAKEARFDIRFSDGTSARVEGNTQNLTTGIWYHLVGTYDGTSLKIFLNGVQDGSTSVSGKTVTANTDLLYFGKMNYVSYPYWVDGSIDEVRIYNRALSASEVTALYKSGGARFGASSADLQQGTTLANGIVGHWTFDGKDTTNTTATDVSGQNNTGTFTGFTRATNAKAGKLGQGMDFDGVNDYVDGGTNASLEPSLPLSLSVWFKLDTLHSTAYSPILHHRSTTVNTYDGYWLQISPTGAVDMNFGDNTRTCVSGGRRTKVSASSLIATDTWYHVTGVIRGATDMDIYINGVNVGGAYGGSGEALAYATNSFLSIGRGGSGNSCALTFFDGTIDDVRIYNRALSASEVKQLYNLGSAKAQASSVTLQQGSTLANGIVGHWTFDGKDTTNATATDMSGQGNNGRFTNFTRATNAKAGKLGQGMSFDGVDDYVDFGNNTSIKPSNPVTLSAWVKITDTGVNPVVATDYTQNVYNGQWMSINAVGTISVNFGDGGNTDIDNRRTKSGVTALAQNTWYHIVGVVRGATDMDIYINGVDDGGTYSGTGGALSVGTGNAVIGSKDSSSANPSEFFNGSMDDVRIYNRALSASEVKQLYLMGK